MKKTTHIITCILLLSTSLFAISDDYALTKEYRLLNDVKLANKQEDYITNMYRILKLNINDQENFDTSKNRFTKILNGLTNGDTTLSLKGTDIKAIRAELNVIQKLWSAEQNNLKDALSNKANKLKAMRGLKGISLHMKKAIALYNISYKRYKQHSKISSIVDRHMSQKQFLAMK